MSIKDRKEREREEMRNLILNTASEIISKEGLEKLSIRKIATQMEYSPAIIYHYFKDKEDIVSSLMRTGYEKIVNVLLFVQVSNEAPEEKLKTTLREYINMALQMPEEYKTILLNNSPSVLKHTSILFKSASMERKALGILYQCVEGMLGDEFKDEIELELTTQIIWTATFGLILRLIIEKDTPKKQQLLLIEYHIKFIINQILLLKRGNVL